MLIVAPSIPRKRVAEESSVNRRDTVSLRSIVAVANKDARSLYRIKLSVKVCARPHSAVNKASSNFSILSNDFNNQVVALPKFP